MLVRNEMARVDVTRILSKQIRSRNDNIKMMTFKYGLDNRTGYLILNTSYFSRKDAKQRLLLLVLASMSWSASVEKPSRMLKQN